MRKILLIAVFIGGCGDLAVYEGADAERDGVTADGMRADGVGADGVGGDVVSADAVDGAVDADGDAVADTATDTAVDSAGDAVADTEQDAAPDVFMCPTGSLVCAVGGPCVPVGTTDQSCGFCTLISCGAGFSCMSPSMTPLDRQCCHVVDQTRDCNSQCAAPAGCEHPTGQPWFCCENP